MKNGPAFALGLLSGVVLVLVVEKLNDKKTIINNHGKQRSSNGIIFRDDQHKEKNNDQEIDDEEPEIKVALPMMYKTEYVVLLNNLLNNFTNNPKPVLDYIINNIDKSNTTEMFHKIRNGSQEHKNKIIISHSKYKTGILDNLTNEKYILNYNIIDIEEKKYITIYLNSNKIINEIFPISTKYNKFYISHNKIKLFRDHPGLLILNTSKGILTNKQADDMGVGGELIAYII